MKIVLINPPIEDFYITSIRRQPLGLLYIASSLKKHGHEVELLNCHTPKKHKLELPAQFSYLKEFIGHKDPLYRFPFGNYQRFGMSSQAIMQKVKSVKADMFLISSLFSTYHEETEEIIRVIKLFHPNTPICIGGYHPTLFPEKFIKRTDVDFVIKGEGEGVVLSLVSKIEDKKLCDRIIGESEKLLNPDNLEVPDRGLLLDRDFSFYKKRGVAIIASRGCPNSCSFCTSRKFWNGNYSMRSVENVLDEIDLCIKKYSVSQFNFEDDNLFVNKARAISFLEGIIKYQEDNNIKLDLSAMNGLSIEKLDNDTVGLMCKAGFKEVNLSLVTTSIQLQKELDRPFDTFKFGQLAEKAKSSGLNVRAYYILGLPNQTKEEIVETIDYLRQLDIKSFPSVFYNITEKEEEWKVQRSSAFYNETEFMNREDLIYLFNLNYQS